MLYGTIVSAGAVNVGNEPVFSAAAAGSFVIKLIDEGENVTCICCDTN